MIAQTGLERYQPKVFGEHLPKKILKVNWNLGIVQRKEYPSGAFKHLTDREVCSETFTSEIDTVDHFVYRIVISPVTLSPHYWP